MIFTNELYSLTVLEIMFKNKYLLCKVDMFSLLGCKHTDISGNVHIQIVRVQTHAHLSIHLSIYICKYTNIYVCVFVCVRNILGIDR